MRFFLIVCAILLGARSSIAHPREVSPLEKARVQTVVTSFLRALERVDEAAATRLCAPTPEMKIALKWELNSTRAYPKTRFLSLKFTRWNWHQSPLGTPVLGVRLDLIRQQRGHDKILGPDGILDIDSRYLLELQASTNGFRIARRIWRASDLQMALGLKDDSLERTAILAEEQVGNPLKLSRLKPTELAQMRATVEKFARAIIQRDEKAAIALSTKPNRKSLRDTFRFHIEDKPHQLRGVRLAFPRWRVWNGQKIARVRALVDWNRRFNGASEPVTKSLLLDLHQTPQGFRLNRQFSYLEHDAALSNASDSLRSAIYLDDYESARAGFPAPVPQSLRRRIETDIRAMLSAHLKQDEAGVRAAWLPQTEAPDLGGVLNGMRADKTSKMHAVSATKFGRWSLEQDESCSLIRVRAWVRWDWTQDEKPNWNERWWIFTLRERDENWKIASRRRRYDSLSLAFQNADSVEERALIAREEHHGETRQSASKTETEIAREWFVDLREALRHNNRARLKELCFSDSPALDTFSENLDDPDLRVIISTLGALKMGRVVRVRRDGKTWIEARAVLPMTVDGAPSDYVFIAQIERDGARFRARRAFWRDGDLIAALGANSVAKAAYLLDFERDRWNVAFLRELVENITKQSLKNEGSVRALHLSEAALQLAAFLGDGDLIAESYGRRGGILETSFKGEKTGESAGVTDDYRLSLAHFRRVGNRVYIGFALHRLGDQAYSVAQYEMAENFEQAALKHAEKVGDTVTQTLVFQSLGDIQNALNKDAEAAKFYERARDLAAREGYHYYEIEALLDLGAWHFNRGEIGRGFSTLDEGLQIARREKMPEQQIDALARLAQGAVITGQWSEAIARLQSAQSLAKSLDDPILEFGIVQNLRTAHGERFLAAGAPKTSSANTTARADLEAVEKLGAELQKLMKKLPLSLANERMAAGSYLRQTGWTLGVAALLPPNEAADFIKDEDDILDVMDEYARQHKHADRVAQVQRLRGELRRLQGRFNEGIQELQAARPYYEAASDNIGALALLARGEGDNWRDQKQWPKAVDAYRTSISLTEKQLAGAGDAGLQSGILAGNVSSYQNLAQGLWRLGADSKEILGAVEAARARALVELMQRGGASNRVGLARTLSGENAKQREELLNLIARLQKQLDAFAAGAKQAQTDDENRALQRAARDLGASEGFVDEAQTVVSPESVRTQLLNARLEFDAFERNLNASTSSTNGSTASSTNEMLSAAELEKLFARHPKRRILMFQVGDQSTLLLVLKRGEQAVETEVFEIPISRANLRAQVESARRGWARPSSISDDTSELQTLLLGNAQSALDGADELVIVPDDSLAALPFAALNDENGDFLLQKFAISYAPGLSALAEMEKRAAALKAESTQSRTPFVALGRSQFAEIGLKALPGARAEIEAIAPTFGPRAVVALDEAATKTRARFELPRAKLVHFATHGLLNESAPLYSSVALAPDKENADGRFYARDFMEMRLDADLVVLSACETALGQSVRGEGVLGLTWALFVAGAPTSVVTQWSVDDAATSALMQKFYAELQNGKTHAIALRDAQLALLKSKTMKHPAYWAPFIAVGAAN